MANGEFDFSDQEPDDLIQQGYAVLVDFRWQ